MKADLSPQQAGDELTGKGKVARSAINVIILSLLTILLGLAVQVVLAASLGAERRMDIYLVAISLPTVVTVVFQATIPHGFVPLLKSGFIQRGEENTWHVFTSIFNLTGIASLGLVTGIMLTSNLVIRALAPGLDTVSREQAASLLRIMMVGSFFDSLRCVLTAAYYAQERFIFPQIAPSVNHCIMLVAALFLLKPLGLVALAVAWTVGSVAMFLIVAPSILKESGYALGFSIHNPQVEGALDLLAPALVVALLTQALPLIDRFVASMLPPGSISYLGYGNKMLEIMMRTLPMGIGLAIFPLMSAHAARGDMAKLRDTLDQGLRWATLGMVPIAIASAILSRPIVAILFQRGAFDSAATIGVASAVSWYMIALLPATWACLMTLAFFSLHEPKTLARLGALVVSLTLILDIALAQAVGYSGIAMTFLVVNIAQAVLMLWLLQKRAIGLLDVKRVGWFLRILLSVCLMGIIIIVVQRLVPSKELSGLRLVVPLACYVLIGSLSYLALLYLVGNAEMRALGAFVKQRLALLRR